MDGPTISSDAAVKEECPADGRVECANRAKHAVSGRRNRGGAINRTLVGWVNYFCPGPVSKSYRAVNAHATQRLRRWFRKKHNISGNGKTCFPEQYLHERLGLVYLPALPRNLPWAKA